MDIQRIPTPVREYRPEEGETIRKRLRPVDSPAVALSKFSTPSFSDHGTPGTMLGTSGMHTMTPQDFERPAKEKLLKPSLELGGSELTKVSGSINPSQLQTLRFQCDVGADRSIEWNPSVGPDAALLEFPFRDPDIDISVSAIVFGLQSAAFVLRKGRYQKTGGSEFGTFHSSEGHLCHVASEIQNYYKLGVLEIGDDFKLGDDLAIDGLERVLEYVNVCQAYCHTLVMPAPSEQYFDDNQKILSFMGEIIGINAHSILGRLGQRLKPQVTQVLPKLLRRRNRDGQQLPDYCPYAIIDQVLPNVDALRIRCPTCDWKIEGKASLILMDMSDAHPMLPRPTSGLVLRSHLHPGGGDHPAATYACVLCVAEAAAPMFETHKALVRHFAEAHSTNEVKDNTDL